MTRHGSARARFGPFEVDLHTHELWKFGTRLKLVGQPFEILAVLLSQPGELVTREELRTRLWPADTFVDFNHGLNAAVNKLREALSDSAGAPRYVETLPRRGYRFMATVEWVEAKRVMAEMMAKTPDALLGETVKPPSSPAEVVLQAVEPPVQAQATGDRALPRSLIGVGVLFAMLLVGALVLKTVSRCGARSSTRSIVEHTRPLTTISDTATPAFSPDGNFVAFYREHSQQGESGIYVTARSE